MDLLYSIFDLLKYIFDFLFSFDFNNVFFVVLSLIFVSGVSIGLLSYIFKKGTF